jgi:glutathione synthase/RimK-type ligase-like ATP-grasp enzyme
VRCGRAFGIDLFSIDVVFSQGQPYVVDINKFGSYMGVPDAPRLLADYIQAAARRARRGESVGPVVEPFSGDTPST